MQLERAVRTVPRACMSTQMSRTMASRSMSLSSMPKGDSISTPISSKPSSWYLQVKRHYRFTPRQGHETSVVLTGNACRHVVPLWRGLEACCSERVMIGGSLRKLRSLGWQTSLTNSLGQVSSCESGKALTL